VGEPPTPGVGSGCTDAVVGPRWPTPKPRGYRAAAPCILRCATLRYVTPVPGCPRWRLRRPRQCHHGPAVGHDALGRRAAAHVDCPTRPTRPARAARRRPAKADSPPHPRPRSLPSAARVNREAASPMPHNAPAFAAERPATQRCLYPLHENQPPHVRGDGRRLRSRYNGVPLFCGRRRDGRRRR